MGKWNRRYLPRRNFRHYDYEDPSLSPPGPYDNNHSYPSGVEDNRVPSWEIDYCNSVRVPWRKILASKKYIYCYPNVLNWDASAGEEALQNAKQRYWTMINGLSCDNPLPDPDIYVDKIDWNPCLDPELMADLELQVFDPDKAQNVENLETINEGIECDRAQYDKNQSTNDNPWERDHVQGTGSLKDAAVQGWSRWDDSINLKNDNNPWEQSCSEHVDTLKDNVWKSGNESRGWHQGIDKSSAFVNYGRGGNNSCNYIRQERWGQRENSSRGGWSHGNSNGEGFKNLGNSRYACENDRNGSCNRKESEYQGNEPNYWDSRSFRRGGGRSSGGGCRKREGFQQNGSKFKSSRYHCDNRQL